jgi:hypothetical protein
LWTWFLQLDRHLLDPAGELERQLIGEIDGRADIHADVESFVGRNWDGNGLRQLAFGGLGVVHHHGHDRAMAEFHGRILCGETTEEGFEQGFNDGRLDGLARRLLL